MSLDIALIKESFEAFQPVAEDAIHYYFEALFRNYPELKPAFEKSDIKATETKALGFLTSVVGSLDNLGSLKATADTISKQALELGLETQRNEITQKFGETLLQTLRFYFKEQWSDELETGWRTVFENTAAIFGSYTAPAQEQEAVAVDEALALFKSEAGKVENIQTDIEMPELPPEFFTGEPTQQPVDAQVTTATHDPELNPEVTPDGSVIASPERNNEDDAFAGVSDDVKESLAELEKFKPDPKFIDASQVQSRADSILHLARSAGSPSIVGAENQVDPTLKYLFEDTNSGQVSETAATLKLVEGKDAQGPSDITGLIQAKTDECVRVVLKDYLNESFRERVRSLVRQEIKTEIELAVKQEVEAALAGVTGAGAKRRAG